MSGFGESAAQDKALVSMASESTETALARLADGLETRLAAARERAAMTAVEREWVEGEELIILVGGVLEKATSKSWEKLLMVRLSPHGLKPVTGASETRIAPTVLANRIKEGLAQGFRVYLVTYQGRKAGTGNEYHNFACEPLK